MNLLHSLEIANLDNAFIRRELGEPLQRLLAARVGENCRRKEPLGLNCRLHVRQCRRRYGPFGRGFLRNGLTDLRCTGPGLGCSRSNRRQVHYFNGDAFLRERNWGLRFRNEAECQDDDGMKDNGERKTVPNRCAMAALPLLPASITSSHWRRPEGRHARWPRGDYHRNLHKKAAANNLSTAALVLMR